MSFYHQLVWFYEFAGRSERIKNLSAHQQSSSTHMCWKWISSQLIYMLSLINPHKSVKKMPLSSIIVWKSKLEKWGFKFSFLFLVCRSWVEACIHRIRGRWEIRSSSRKCSGWAREYGKLQIRLSGVQASLLYLSEWREIQAYTETFVQESTMFMHEK